MTLDALSSKTFNSTDHQIPRVRYLATVDLHLCHRFWIWRNDQVSQTPTFCKVLVRYWRHREKLHRLRTILDVMSHSDHEPKLLKVVNWIQKTTLKAAYEGHWISKQRACLHQKATLTHWFKEINPQQPALSPKRYAFMCFGIWMTVLGQ